MDMSSRDMVLIALVTGMLVPSAWAKTEFSRYQGIIDRMPFGRVAAAPEVVTELPAAPVAPPVSQSFVRNLKLCALKLKGDDVRVGFIDKNAKPQKSYFLNVGETSADGIKVVEADFVEEKALLSKDGLEYWIYMTGWAEPGGAVAAAPDASGAPAGAPGARTSSPVVSRTPSPSGSSAARGSYLDRLRTRREALAKRNEAIVKSRMEQPSGVAMQKKLEDYNMQLIREGKPPLPVQLTKEQDDQLVKEGVLPPAAAEQGE